MSHPIIDLDRCVGCCICAEACEQDVIVMDFGRGIATVENEDDCVACAECRDDCPMGAITEVIVAVA